jgi:hypothetical protein
MGMCQEGEESWQSFQEELSRSGWKQQETSGRQKEVKIDRCLSYRYKAFRRLLQAGTIKVGLQERILYFPSYATFHRYLQIFRKTNCLCNIVLSSKVFSADNL